MTPRFGSVVKPQNVIFEIYFSIQMKFQVSYYQLLCNESLCSNLGLLQTFKSVSLSLQHEIASAGKLCLNKTPEPESG